MIVNCSVHPVLSPSDVFDQPQPVGNKKIEFHISTDMPAAFKKELEKEDDFEEQNPGKHVLVLFFFLFPIKECSLFFYCIYWGAIG